jgi:hypothetical protein
MRTEVHQINGRGGLAVVGLAALALAGLSAPAISAAKSKSVASTKSANVPLGPGSAVSTTAKCKSGSHISGGGYQVSPSFTPSALTGVRSDPTSSTPSGATSWSAGGAAFATPAVSGTETVFARCEKNSEGRIVQLPFGSGTAILGTVTNVTLNCASGTHVLAGGFTVSPPPNLADPNKAGAQVLQSRRTATGQWTITVGNPLPPAGVVAASFSASALCELNQGSEKVKEVSSTAPIGDDARTTADASCSKKKHLVSGGFLVSPNSGTAPAVGIDEFQPSGSRKWHTGLYEFPGFNLPAGSSLTTYAYCKKGK